MAVGKRWRRPLVVVVVVVVVGNGPAPTPARSARENAPKGAFGPLGGLSAPILTFFVCFQWVSGRF